MTPAIQRPEDEHQRRPRLALVMAAVVGALFGGLAVGTAGLGFGALTSSASGAVSGGVVIGTAIIFVVALMWNLESRAVARVQERTLGAEIGQAWLEIAAGRERARKLSGLAAAPRGPGAASSSEHSGGV